MSQMPPIRGAVASTNSSEMEVQGNLVEELSLELSHAKLSERGGISQLSVKVRFLGGLTKKSPTLSDWYILNVPLGSIEIQELRWYLEEYHAWPDGQSRERARQIEEQLPYWGKALYEAVFLKSRAPWWKFWKAWKRSPYSNKPVRSWLDSSNGIGRKLSVSAKGINGDAEGNWSASSRAIEELLSLPWELMNNGEDYLLQQNPPTQIMRRLCGRENGSKIASCVPIRVLSVSPRPEDKHTPYIDHRMDSLSLVTAMKSLGELVEITILNSPSSSGLQAFLEHANANNQRFHVLHFHGYGTHDMENGMEYLYFEDPDDVYSSGDRAAELVSSNDFAKIIAEQHNIPLVFLAVRQSDNMTNFSTPSLAGKLVQAGTTSVITMDWSVPVETTRKFYTSFYRELSQGHTIGQAIIKGQRALMDDPLRDKGLGNESFMLQDWFAPVLYQADSDPQFCMEILPEEAQDIQSRIHIESGDLPEIPHHHFVGRSRELLKIERMLDNGRYVVVRGQGGIGKTALTAELARWLLQTGKFRKAVFAAMDAFRDIRGVLDSLGRQLMTQGEGWTVAQYDSQHEALADVIKVLRKQPALIVLDNLESVIPGEFGSLLPEVPVWQEFTELCKQLLETHDLTRIIFTSRERLPEPFGHGRQEMDLGALERNEAIELVRSVMALEGWLPKSDDPEHISEEVAALVDAANCHPRALVLLAREISRDGLSGTTRELKDIMADLDARYPGDRELSLYASLELSLRRLKPEFQIQAKVLSVFHSGVSAKPFQSIVGTGVDEDAIISGIFRELEEVGLGEYMGKGYLRLDPALSPYLASRMDKEELESLESLWAKSMSSMSSFLYEKHFHDTATASHLTILELPNLLGMLRWGLEQWTPEETIDRANKLETLLARLGNPRSLAQVVSIREEASKRLEGTGWSHARFLAEITGVERMLDRHDLPGSLSAARKLLNRCLDAGKTAYPNADYDLALTYLLLGKSLRAMGEVREAQEALSKAVNIFQALPNSVDVSARRMAAVSIMELGACHRLLGSLDWASRAYETALGLFEALDDSRNMAVAKERLGTIRMYQEQYEYALKLYEQTREIFDKLRDPISVAGVWHKMGVVYRKIGSYNEAEEAYRKALAINVQHSNRSGEAGVLNEMGNLYDSIERLEDAVVFYRRAANTYAQLGKKLEEGKARSNTAIPLIDLERYDEARRELERSLLCKSALGHTAQPWRTWDIMHRLEIAVGNREAASIARENALQTYLDYRKAGGASRSPTKGVFQIVSSAIQYDDPMYEARDLSRIINRHAAPHAKALTPRLNSILKGDRSPDLAKGEDISYMDAVELRLLLEELTAAG